MDVVIVLYIALWTWKLQQSGVEHASKTNNMTIFHFMTAINAIPVYTL